MAKSIAKRQQVRRGLLLVTMLLFPLIYYFLSPYLIIDAAVRGIVNGSFIMFALLFVSGLIVGRGWCG
ncbi:MAG: 4Fe-4S ferredoxin, partial [Caldilinea sp.]